MSSRKYDINEAYLQALQEMQMNEARSHKERIDEEFTIETFNNKYKPLYNGSVEVDGNRVYADNISLKGSGMSKKVEATLNGDYLRIDNEFIGISYDGTDIEVHGQYWFTSDFEDNEEFHNKVVQAVETLYRDMKKLQKSNVQENKEILDEKKKYWPPVYHEYEIDGHNFDFKCQYYEVSGSSQASLWGHDVELRMDGNVIAHRVIPYYNRTWETWEFQTAMLSALSQYQDACKEELFRKQKDELGVKSLKADQKEQILANNEWYQMLEKLYHQISGGDKGKVEESKKTKTEGQLWGEDRDYDRQMNKTMQEFANQLVNNLTSSGWDYDDSSAKYGRYRFKKGKIEVEYCDNFDKVGIADFTINNVGVLKLLARNLHSDYYDGNDYVTVDFGWTKPNVTQIVDILNQAEELKEDYIRTNLDSGGFNPQNVKVSLDTARQTLQDLEDFEDAAENLGYAPGISDEFNEKLDEFIEEEEWPEYNRIEKEVNRVEQEEIDKSKQPPKKTRKKKTEDIDDEDEEEDPYGETISLFAMAYREVPEVGVEEWGKDDEYLFCLDTKKFLADLEEYEVEIPKAFYNENYNTDWSNGIDDYLMEFKGIDPDSAESDNTYNWGSRLTHDLNLNFYDGDDGFYVAIEIHKSGDVRGNYTTRFLLRFDNRDDWYEACYEAQANNTNTIELDGKHYRIEPDFWSEHCNIWCEEDNNGWDEIYCENKEELRNLIANEEPMY